jgi:maleylpyruvate isomerase
MTAPTEVLEQWERGERHLGTALGRLTEDEFDGPSLLPGWTRRHVLAHLAGNAGAIVNLLTWARTGVETPMYASDDARDAQIEELSTLPTDQLRTAVLSGTGRLVDAVRAMPAAAWAATVRTRQGHELPAAEVPAMRAREVWVHSVDLDAGIAFADVPDDVLAGVVDDVFRQWDVRDVVPDVALFAGDREWGTGALAVAGPLAEAAAWVTGRSAGEGLQADGPLPQLPPWR